MTLVLNESAIRAAVDMPRLVSALADGLRREHEGAGMVLPARMNLHHGPKFLRVMPAILPASGLYGLKFFAGDMAAGVRYVIVVGSLEDGKVMALLDSAYLTAARTGATSGVATDILARRDASIVGLIGSGLEARTNLAAIAAVRDLTEVRVFSRSADRRAAFAAEMEAELGVPVSAVESPEASVKGTDIVLVATNTGLGGEPAYSSEWLEPGQHVVSIGSTSHNLREIDPGTFLRADSVVLDAALEQMKEESGDVMALVAQDPDWSGALLLEDLLVSGDFNRKNDEITLFKSVGSAAQDLLAAAHVMSHASEIGVGHEIADIAEPKVFG